MDLLQLDYQTAILILMNPCKYLQDLYQGVILGQFLLSGVSSNTFTLKIVNSPFEYSKIQQVFKNKNKIVTVTPVYVKSASKTSSFVYNSEFICQTCCESFSFANDLTWGNILQAPDKCYAFSSKVVPSSLVYTNEKCQGNGFDLLEGSVVYSDFQEFVASDGKNEMNVIVQGSLCNSFKIGDSLELTGIYTQRWLANLESEYSFIALSLSHKQSSLIKAGLSALKFSLEDKSDFEVREIILRSSFGAIFGNYNVKLALLQNLLGQLCGVTFNTLVLGEISTGKSTLATRLAELFPDNCKLLNGVLTDTKIFSKNKIMNLTSGQSETGFLHSDYILVIDNFKELPDKKVLLKAMEGRSIIALLEANEDIDFNEINKVKKLVSDFDKFDVIVSMKNYEGNENFRKKKLGNFQYEDFMDLWDFDTIKGYLLGKVRKFEEIKILSEKVELLLEKFIEYIVTFNLKNCEMTVASGLSVRLLESLIKISKINSILMGHTEVSILDVFDSIILLKYSYKDEVFVDYEVYKSTILEIKSDIELYCGELDIF